MNNKITKDRRLSVFAIIFMVSILYGLQSHLVRSDIMSPLPAQAIVTIENPRSASLLQLRGYTGTGNAYFKIDGQCALMHVRFVAGDFGGEGIGTRAGEPIHLLITNSRIVRKLHQGYDLISDDVTVGADTSVGKGSDVTILSGLSPQTGFVINAGGSVMADLFGGQAKPVDCKFFDAAHPAAGS